MRHHLRGGKDRGQRVTDVANKAPRMSTDKKVLWGICGVFLVGVAYSLWIGMQVIGCCG